MSEATYYTLLRPFKDWFVRTFRVWPKIIWGEPDGGVLRVYGGSHKVEGLYGLSVGSRFVGGMKLKYQGAAEPMPLEVRATVLCGCGQVHSIEDWQQCPRALTPKPNDPWWRALR